MEEARSTSCPICAEGFELEEELEKGDITYCPNCDSELRIISLNPPTVEEVESPEDLDSGEDGYHKDEY